MFLSTLELAKKNPKAESLFTHYIYLFSYSLSILYYITCLFLPRNDVYIK